MVFQFFLLSINERFRVALIEFGRIRLAILILFVNSHEPNLPDFARSFRVIRRFGSRRTNSGEFGVRGLERRATIVSRLNLPDFNASRS